MKALTLEEEIDVLVETRGLPVGQRCMRLQYPEVTIKDLEARFAVHAIAAAQQRQEEERFYREIAEAYRCSPEEARKRFALDLERGIYSESRGIEMRMAVDMMDAMRFNQMMRSGQWDPINDRVMVRSKTVKMKRITGAVKMDRLDDYMGDTIPDRVLDSLEVAKEAGLRDFYVAYPVLKVEEVTVQKEDPVLIAKLGDRMLEIDMWE